MKRPEQKTTPVIIKGAVPLTPPISPALRMDRVPFSERSVASSAFTECSTESDANRVNPASPTNQGFNGDPEQENEKLRASMSSITLEEFEFGKSPPEALQAPIRQEFEYPHQQQQRSYLQEAALPHGDIVDLLTLASNPVVPDYSDDVVDEVEVDQPDAENSDAGESGKSHSGKNRSSKANIHIKESSSTAHTDARSHAESDLPDHILELQSDKVTIAGVIWFLTGDQLWSWIAVHSSCPSCEQRYLPLAPPSLSVSEWRQIERCLWEIDRAGTPTKCAVPPQAKSGVEAGKHSTSLLHRLTRQVQRFCSL